MNIEELHKIIEDYSAELGFLDYGAAPCRKMTRECERLKLYISKSYNAKMQYLEKNLELREDPAMLMEGTQSVMCFLAPYKPQCVQGEGVPIIASYAYGEDYHKAVKDKLYLMVERMKSLIPDIRTRVFVDSAPVMEREWAREAGLGFIGKNNFLISKKHGLHTFIGIILVDRVLKYSSATERNSCGDCHSCIDACPTDALREPFCLDARRCISYQTIESKKPHMDEEFVIELGNRIFGCDICLNACPWSKRGEETKWEEFKPLFSPNRNKPVISYTREDWTSMDEDEFSSLFKNSPLKRAGFSKILDNLGGH